ncbi:MAG TPA: hypothetical protein DDX71_01690 [Ruminococcus sp.]|nr:hypothetical protein [Ruminococcus sp.]
MKQRFTAALTASLLLLTGTGNVSAAVGAGDLNLDGNADLADAKMLMQELLGGGAFTQTQAETADLSGDGKLNAVDLSLLLQMCGTADRLVWSDEFEGDQLDASKWSYELGNWKLDASGNYITGGWGNNEQEFYTDSNAAVHDGILTIAARHETYTDERQGTYEYTSARLSTQYKFSTCGGRIEVRARCDAGKSLWPAIWMLPEDSLYGGWAASGEIDIMEGWGSTPEKICGTIHFGDVWPNNTYLTNDYVFPAGDSTENWHTYAVEWSAEEMRWYVDDTLYSTQTGWYSANEALPASAPFDQNFYVILNLAVGGHFDGVDGIYGDPATFADGEKHFDIDYVRVYQTADSFAPSEVASLPLELYAEGADADLMNRGDCTIVTVRKTGTLPYGVMGLLRGQKFDADTRYQVSFTASSSVPREMLVTLENSAYDRLHEQTCQLTENFQEYSFTFDADTAQRLDLKFQLGAVGDAASLPEHHVKIGFIRIEPVQEGES